MVSIVIRCYNEEKHIGKLLTGIFEQEFDGRLEVIVIDSGSTDATLTIVKRFPVKIAKIKKEYFSFGRSLNMGIKSSRGDYLVFISAHCYPIGKDWLSNLLTPFKEKEIGLVYGKQRGDKRTKFSEQRLFLKLFPDKSNLNQPTPFCNNANCAIRRSLWELIPYDEKLTGLEDLDWAKKIMAKGFRLAYHADAGVVHIHEESWSQVFRRYEREAIAMSKILPNLKFSIANLIKMFFSNVAFDYHNIRRFRGGRDIWEIPTFRLMEALGTYKGSNFSGPISENLKRKFYYYQKIGASILRNGNGSA